jgi:hypothetical protein
MKKYYFILLSILILFISCSKSDPAPENTTPKSALREITKVVFTKADNPNLNEDVEATINGTTITAVVYGVAKNNLKATITHNGKTINNSTVVNFTNPVLYTITAEDGSSTIYTVNVSSRDIYVAGADYDNVALRYRAVYWKNGVITVLADPGVHATASSICIVGNDVYVSGTIRQTNLQQTSVYWKNGNIVQLETSSTVSGTSIAVSGTDVYVLQSYPSAYWKNGVKVPILQSPAYTNTIYNFGNDIYITGETTGNTQAAYWKNGVITTLGNGWASKMTVVGTDVHVVGQDIDKAIYWKNGVRTDLGKGGAISVVVSGTDTYVSGVDNTEAKSKAVYWKNLTKTLLTNGTNDARAGCIEVIGSDIYVTGDETIGGIQRAAFWINGKQTLLSTKKSFIAGLVIFNN